MRRKKVWRYYCEYCGKANCSGASISRHEKSCTMNPNRACRMHKMFSDEIEQPKTNDLLALLPNPEGAEIEDEWGSTHFLSSFVKEIENAMPALRKATDNCPACIMAALRQKGIPVPMVESFNFTKECDAWWAEFNDQQMGGF